MTPNLHGPLLMLKKLFIDNSFVVLFKKAFKFPSRLFDDIYGRFFIQICILKNKFPEFNILKYREKFQMGFLSDFSPFWIHSWSISTILVHFMTILAHWTVNFPSKLPQKAARTTHSLKIDVAKSNDLFCG